MVFYRAWNHRGMGLMGIDPTWWDMVMAPLMGWKYLPLDYRRTNLFNTKTRRSALKHFILGVVYIYIVYIYKYTCVCVCRISQFKEAKQHLKMAEETSTQHHTKPPAQFRHKTEPGNTVFSSLCPRALQIQYPSTWSLRMSSVGKVCIQLINGACLMMYTSALRFKWFRGS